MTTTLARQIAEVMEDLITEDGDRDINNRLSSLYTGDAATLVNQTLDCLLVGELPFETVMVMLAGAGSFEQAAEVVFRRSLLTAFGLGVEVGKELQRRGYR